MCFYYNCSDAKLPITNQLAKLVGEDDEGVNVQNSKERIIRTTAIHQILKKNDEFAKLLYSQVIKNSKMVEEERRLLYLAATQEKQSLIIDYDVDEHSPLLDEFVIE